ncbi:MAG: trypsin-like peptidase domain-containing protein [Planctomycetes bacterium]|nr:trypsin-like peptidase domain-containing protein [Planctomycetota bacterium]
MTTSRLAQTALSEAHAARDLARTRGEEADRQHHYDQMQHDMVSPIVQLSGGGSVGSGMVLATRDRDDEKRDAYVLTSFHVIRNILAGSTTERRAEIATTIYRAKGASQHEADLLEFDEELDLALLRVSNVGAELPSVTFATESEERATQVFTPIYTVGCPLGADPIPTRGEILRKDHELDGQDYWMISSPAYFGNSGGGVYLEGSRHLIGIFSKIYTYGRTNPVVIPHMGLLTPTSVLRQWLADHGHADVAPEVPTLVASSNEGGK